MSETNGKAGQIFTLLPQLMAEVGSIEKGRRNLQQNYAFRGIDDVYAAVQGIFATAGVFVIPEVIQQTREERQTQKGGTLIYTILTVRHTFYAGDGSSVAAVTVGEAMDSGDKSSNKAMSAAMKYALIETLCIPTADPKDTENDNPVPAPRQQQRPVQRRQEQKPEPSDALSDPEDFRRALHAAFKGREFDADAEKRAVEAVKAHYKVKALTDLKLEQRHVVIDHVMSGGADKHMNGAAA